MKLIRMVIIVVVLLVIVGFLALKMVPGIVSSSLSKKMQVAVKIDEVGVSPTRVQIDDFEIKNPTDFSRPLAFSAGSIVVTSPLLNYLKNPLVIDEIVINDLFLGLEISPSLSSVSNWSKILNNLRSATPAPAEKKGAKATEVLIKKLVVKNITAELVLLKGTAPISKTIKLLEFNDISSDSGVPLEQIAMLLIEQVYGKDKLQSLVQGALQSPEKSLQQLNDSLNKIFPK